MQNNHNLGLWSSIRPIAAWGLLILLAACSSEESAEPGANSTAGGDFTVFQGARLIIGDDSATIENGTLIVSGDQITAIGPSESVSVPAGATVVDITGATVMPMIVDTHVHLSGERDALIEDLRARARFGVSAAMSLGTDQGEAVFQVRDEVIPGAAIYRTAGRGIVMPEPGRGEVPHWVTSPEEGRAAVQEETALDVDIVKIWVDDRDGQYEKMPPEIYSAIIDEAHQNNTRVTAHIFNLSDAKGLLQAGIDAFAHGIRDTYVDDEVVQMFLARPNVVLVPNLPGRGVPTDYDWLEGQIPGEQLQNLQSATANPEAQAFYTIQARNLDRLSNVGVTIALGTDGNTPWAPHVEMEDMVVAGMTTQQVITAATANAAAFMRLDNMGTLEAGKNADFIILDANPLEDITNTRMIRDVYLRGELVDR